MKDNKFFVHGMLAMVLAFGLFFAGCGTTTDSDGYAIGDNGPGGGLVFYDKGSTTDGWRYLEVAPASTEWKGKGRGADGESFGTPDTSIGSGKTNTAKMVAKLTELNESGKAAQLCDGLDFGGKDDWFLPSKDELHEMYTNLVAKGRGDFDLTREAGYAGYLSSSETSLRHVWHQDFSTGEQIGGYELGRVRAVRAF
jgi:hypothetical protein